jgi:hypothetical protein
VDSSALAAPIAGWTHRGRRRDAVAIVDQVFVSTLVSDRLCQLLPRPLCAWMGGDVIVNEAAVLRKNSIRRL